MKILKLPWLSHKAENKAIECYSISVNSQGTKLASGGLDGKVKVWDIQSIVSYQEPPTPEALPSLQQRMEQPHTLERPLASMSRHNGVVTSVKFSPDGRYLASGSDDKIVLIWEKDDEKAARPKSFGETEADIEHWTVRKRLVAHDNDVQDISWSPDGSLLITVGLDRSIIIWNAVTFERIKRYDIHQSMVKGIVFDPANKYFATASDDRSVRIFRYYKKMNEGVTGAYEFQMEQVVMDPFQKSPLTSYFRRMSWSPDGQHIAVPNATNGPVTSVVVISRGHWGTDVSLIGHEAPCEVCSFSPRMYGLDGKDEPTTVIATGGQDRTLAVWSTASTKPLLVARDLVSRSITDMAWTPDGRALFVSSLDGSITCLLFSENELGVVVSSDAVGSQLVKFGGDQELTVMPESVDQLRLEATVPKKAVQEAEPAKLVGDGSGSDILADYKTDKEGGPASTTPALSSMPLASPTVLSVPRPSISNAPSALSIPAPPTNLTSKEPATMEAPKLQKVTVTKAGRKRVTPTLVSGSANQTTQARKSPSTRRLVSSKISHSQYALPKFGVRSVVGGIRSRFADGVSSEKNNEDLDNDNEDMGIHESGTQRTSSVAGMRSRAKKYRKLLMDRKYPTPFKMVSGLPEALFSNQAVINHELKRIIQKDELFETNNGLVNTASLETVDECLFFRVLGLSTEHSEKIESGTEKESDEQKLTASFIEVRNGPSWPEFEDATDFAQRIDFKDPTQVLVTNDEQSASKSYILHFPYKIQQAIPILLQEELKFYVLISFDGLTQVISAKTGSYVAPAIELGSNVVATRQNGRYFLLLTSMGLVFCWKMPEAAKQEFRIEPVVKGISVAPALNSEVQNPGDDKKPVVVDDLRQIEVDCSGTPYIVVARTNSVFAYSSDLMVWTKVSDPWYFHALEQREIDETNRHSTYGQLLRMTFREKQQGIQRGLVPKYLWPEDSELKSVMRKRFYEALSGYQ